MFIFSLKQAFDSIWRNLFSSIVSVLSVGVTFSLALIILWGYISLQKVDALTGMSASVTALVSPSAGAREVDNIRDFIKSKDFVSQARLVTAKEALKGLKKQLQDASGLLESLYENPLPDSFEISVVRADTEPKKISEFINDLQAMPGIMDVYPSSATQLAFTDMACAVSAYSHIVLLLIMLIAVCITGGAVRLNMLAYKKKLLITSLVGASPTQLRLPFIIEGILISIFGGIIALLFYFVTFFYLVAYLNPAFDAIGIGPVLTSLNAIEILISLFLLWFISGIISFLVVGRVETVA